MVFFTCMYLCLKAVFTSFFLPVTVKTTLIPFSLKLLLMPTDIFKSTCTSVCGVQYSAQWTTGALSAAVTAANFRDYISSTKMAMMLNSILCFPSLLLSLCLYLTLSPRNLLSSCFSHEICRCADTWYAFIMLCSHLVQTLSGCGFCFPPFVFYLFIPGYLNLIFLSFESPYTNILFLKDCCRLSSLFLTKKNGWFCCAKNKHPEKHNTLPSLPLLHLVKSCCQLLLSSDPASFFLLSV